MEILGINWNYLFIQVLVGSWPLLSLVALFLLHRRHLIGSYQFLWALLIIAIPVLGALTFFIVIPVDGKNF